MNFPTTPGQRLKAYIRARWTRQMGGDVALAQKAGVRRQTLQDWYSGASVPRLTELAEVAGAMGVRRVDLVAAYDGVTAPQTEKAPRPEWAEGLATKDDLQDVIEAVIPTAVRLVLDSLRKPDPPPPGVSAQGIEDSPGACGGFDEAPRRGRARIDGMERPGAMTATAWVGRAVIPAVAPAVVASAITGLSTLLFLATGPTLVHDAFGSVAAALLDGRLVVPDGSSAELVPRGDGWSYVPFPPIPALPMALAQLGGLRLENSVASGLAGGGVVALTYALARGLGAAPASALYLQAGIAASILWMAATGGTWLYAQLLGAAFALGSLTVAARGGHPLVAGLLLGLAAGSRLPLGLLLPLVLYLYRDRSAWVAVVAGACAVAVPLALYNVARFGSPFEFGYGLIASSQPYGPTVLSEPWYADGVMSWTYIPRSLGAMLFSGFDVVVAAPWLRPDYSGLSITLTMPVLLLAVGARRNRLGAIAIGVALLVMVPNWAHGNWGFYQYGYRFALDAIPALVVALAVAYRARPSRLLVAAGVLAAAVNLYGLWVVSFGFVAGPTVL